MSFTQTPYSTFKEWEAAGKGESARYDGSMLIVGQTFPMYCDGWIKRRWATCKITSIQHCYGGYNYTFDVYRAKFCNQLYDKAEENPWYWEWFGIF
jgi:hypothetical protein